MKTCIKCGRGIDSKETAHQVVDNLWRKAGYVCDDCADTYPKEDIRDPDVEGDKVETTTKKEEPPTWEEVRLRKLEATVTAICDMVINCMSDQPFFCNTRRCKDDEYGTGCPIAEIRDFRDSMIELRATWSER